MAYFRCTTGGSGKGNTLVVTCADDLAGATITCTNGTKTYRKTCPSTAPYEVTFYGLEAGTWTVSATVSGNTYTTTVVVVDCAALLGGFNWRTWVDTASQLDSSDYDSLDEVLADELAVRELCLEHACVDYLADIATANRDVETIISNDLFAKWVNNSDYSLDVLGANVVIKALMDEADKYGYGEWCLMPQVPKMTSNTAPYGEVSDSSHYGNCYPWHLFNGGSATTGDANLWAMDNGISTGWVQYKSVAPIKVASFMLQNAGNSTYQQIKDFILQGSNDGSTWVDLLSTTNPNVLSQKNYYTVAIEDREAFLYHRLTILNTHGGNVNLANVQFYAWAPKGNVPVMTSDTAPYGTVLYPNSQSGNDVWHIFDKNVDRPGGGTSTTMYMGYRFNNPVKVKCAEYMALYNSTYSRASFIVKLQASNDSATWVDLTEEITIVGADYGKTKITVTKNEDYYLAYRIYYVTSSQTPVGGNYYSFARELQFYGRELKVSVPKMDSATPPFGSLIYNIDPQTDNRPWYAFDNNSATAAMTASANQVPFRIGYDFGKLVRVAYLAYIPLKSGESSSLTSHTDTFYYSVDGITWNVLATNEVTNANAKQINLVSFDHVLCKAVKYETDTPTMSNGYSSMSELLIFGEDYSEKEFEEGTTKKWLYDHGVELDTLIYRESGSGYIERLGSQVKANGGSTANNIAQVNCQNIDFSNYSLLRAIIGDYFYSTNQNTPYIQARSNDDVTAYALLRKSTISNPYTDYVLDISSVSDTGMFVFGTDDVANTYVSARELWLE